MWILTAIYFLAFSAVIWAGFWLYAKALMYLGRRGFIAKNIVGLVVYIAFACLLVSPMFMAFSLIEAWSLAFNTDKYYMFYFLFCFLLAVVPGGIYFKNNYLNDLKSLGYFAKRQ
ncbi:hypothetical protein [Endozoicomonas acroporae]|uniref:hypothetical protein n=1 Tax=Endozoicomonas acroporae TaxID=1701104 RepID=UPI003D7B9DA0